jgi:hypothetical protein
MSDMAKSTVSVRELQQNLKRVMAQVERVGDRVIAPSASELVLDGRRGDR